MNSARKSNGERTWKFRFGPVVRPSPCGSGKARQASFSGLVHDFPAGRHLDQPREAERAARHVIHHPLEARAIARRQEHRLVDVKTAMRPAPHVLDDLRFDFVLGQVQGEDGFPPSAVQPLDVEFG